MKKLFFILLLGLGFSNVNYIDIIKYNKTYNYKNIDIELKKNINNEIKKDTKSKKFKNKLKELTPIKKGLGLMMIGTGIQIIGGLIWFTDYSYVSRFSYSDSHSHSVYSWGYTDTHYHNHNASYGSSHNHNAYGLPIIAAGATINLVGLFYMYKALTK